VLDLYGSYFFMLSSHLPLVVFVVTVLALVVFLSAIAWAAWPAAALVICALAYLLVSLQFIVYGCHRLALGLAWMLQFCDESRRKGLREVRERIRRDIKLQD
jgi:hypothetical protein